MGVELQGDKVGIEEVSIRGGVQVKRSAAKAEGDVLEAKGNGVGGADGVFAGPQKKEKPKGCHVANGMVVNGVRGKGNCE